MNLHFYRCNVCGKIIAVLSDTKVPTYCCGQPMQKLIPNQTDGAVEKHVPVITAAGNAFHISVGSDPHPMTESHSICWIGLCSDHGFFFKELHPGDLAEADFLLTPDDRLTAAYAYCNLHGLWIADNGKETL